MTRLVIRNRLRATVAELVVEPAGVTVVRCNDPVLAALLQELAAAPHLPAATRTPLADGATLYVAAQNGVLSALRYQPRKP